MVVILKELPLDCVNWVLDGNNSWWIAIGL